MILWRERVWLYNYIIYANWSSNQSIFYVIVKLNKIMIVTSFIFFYFKWSLKWSTITNQAELLTDIHHDSSTVFLNRVKLSLCGYSLSLGLLRMGAFARHCLVVVTLAILSRSNIIWSFLLEKYIFVTWFRQSRFMIFDLVSF